MPVEQHSKKVPEKVSKIEPSKMTGDEFVNAFGSLYEHSPWVASRTYDSGVSKHCDNLDGLAQALSFTLDNATHEEKLALIRAHPDLAGKAATAGTLTSESSDEQSSAGLDQCSHDELKRFHSLNDAYKVKFEFPFIMAVKNSNRHLIIAAFEQRINNSQAGEFATAINEINKIARLRLKPFFTSE